jgi:ubiquitin-activating enzyme E1
MSEIIESVTKQKLPDHVKTIKLELCCSDADGEDLEVPYVRYKLF